MTRLAKFFVAAGALAAVGLLGFFLMRSRPTRQTGATLGVILPQTGPTAFIGEAVRRGLDLAHEQFAALPDNPRVRLIYEDDGGSADRAVSAFRKLTALNRADAVILVSTAVRAVAPLAEQEGVPLLCTAVSASGVSQGRRWVFRYFINADADAALIGDYAARRRGYRRLAVLFINDEMGVSYKTVFERTIAAGGASLVSAVPFGFEVTNFRPLLLKIKASEPDALYLVGYNDAIAVIPSQMREVGLRVPILSVGTISQPEIMKQAGTAIEGAVYTTTAFNTFAPATPALQRFVQAYTSRYGNPPVFFEVFGFDSFNLLASALRKAGPGRAGVRDALAALTNVDGAAGSLSVGSDGEVAFPIKLRQIRAGQWADLEER